jgi:hypothetical protein
MDAAIMRIESGRYRRLMVSGMSVDGFSRPR